jgi:hypothetical protein
MTNTETATSSQVDYIRRLQDDKAHWRTLTVESDEDIARQACKWASRIRAAERHNLVYPRRPVQVDPLDLEARAAAKAGDTDRLAEVEARIGQQAVTERHTYRAQQIAALDADPATLTKAEASQVIDTLKGVYA